MALDFLTRRVPVAKAASLAPKGAYCLLPFEKDDFQKLADANSKYPAWKTRCTGPARSRKEEKWYRALVGVVADGLGRQPEGLHWDLKKDAGKIVAMVDTAEFGILPVLKSSTEMDDEEYHAYVRIAEALIFTKYLPNVRRKDVYQRVYELTGERPPKAKK
jgi:hypothetical protein